MGMYTGVFNVYDDSSPVSGVNTALANANSAPAASPSGTCGASGGVCGCGGGVAKKPAATNSVPVVAETSIDTASNENIQTIKATYTSDKFLDPNTFKVKKGTKVRLEIDVKDNGSGCGYAMTIPTLYDNIVPIKAGVPIVMEFTPTATGLYNITCSMGMINFGTIVVE